MRSKTRASQAIDTRLPRREPRSSPRLGGRVCSAALCHRPAVSPRPGVFPVVLAVALLGAGRAGAQEGADPIHVRLGVAVGGVVGFARDDTSGQSVSVGSLGPALHLDLGAQLTRQAAVYLHGEVATSGITREAAGYLVGEWTPLRWLSLGTGVGVDAMSDFCGCGEPEQWSAVSIPVLVGLDVWRRDRHALRIGLEWAGGDERSTRTFGWHTALTFGWAYK
jgi:hypothetical protein